MKKQITIFIVLVLGLILFNKFLMGDFLFSSTVNTDNLVNNEKVSSQKLFDKSWAIIKNTYYLSDLNGQDWARWKRHYKNKIKTDADANIAINTMLESLDDPYSRYLNKDEYKEQNTSIDSKITGIGVNIASIGGKTYVVNVIEDTPAYKSKIKDGDIICKVNGKNVSGMKTSQVADLVRGPENTSVNLTIMRHKKLKVIKVTRKEIKIKTVKSSIINKEIGYIQILSFIGATTTTEFVSAIEKTDKTKGLIIDLRGNTGGLLPNAVFMANMFINNGNIVSIVGRNGYRKNIYAQNVDNTIKKPIIILVDGNSASASEIFSGALKDYHIAELIGTKTFGKGMVQKIIPMPNQTGLNLTIAKYLTPAGHDINKKGIKPDITVKFTKQDVLKKDDVQLDKAKSVMTQILARNEN